MPRPATNPEPDKLDDARRKASGGTFLRLSSGHTWYEAAGPADAQTVILVHGTTVPSFVWDPQFDALVQEGFRVVRYDLFGRGLSDRPGVRYDLDLYVRQLEEVIEQVKAKRPVDLVGLSLGGVIASELTRRRPDDVRKLALVGPAGIAKGLPFIVKLANAPVLGEYLMRTRGRELLTPSRRNFLHKDRFGAFDARYLETIRFEGSRRAVLSTVRHAPIDGYESRYRELGSMGKPILLVWGRQDEVIPFHNSDRVRALLRPEQFVVVEDCGHLANTEQPGVVNPALLSFLRG
jgi:pimeloyl-ACP methyl ester carboxylesterase